MKDCVIRFRCTEEEKSMIERLAGADVWAESVSDYLLGLVRTDAELYREAEVYAVVRGINRAGEDVEKRRALVGTVLIEKETGKSSKKEYSRLWKAACDLMGSTADRPNHRMYLECDGQEVETNAFTMYAIFDPAAMAATKNKDS